MGLKKETSLRNDSGFSLAVILFPVLIIGGLVTGAVYYHSVQSLKKQTSVLQKEINSSIVVQTFSKELPSGSVQFAQLSPTLQAAVNSQKTIVKQTNQVSEPLYVTNVTNESSINTTSNSTALLSSANSWLQLQTFNSGIGLNGSNFSSLTGSNLVDTNGTLSVDLNNAVSTSDIQNGAVTLGKLDSTNCSDGYIAQISSSSWSCNSLDSGISSTDLQTSAVTLDKIDTSACSDSVDFLEFSGGNLGCDSLSDSIATDYIQQGAVTFDKLGTAGCSDYDILQYLSGSYNCAIVNGVSGGLDMLNGFTDPSLTISLDNNGSAPGISNSNDNIDISIPYASDSTDGVLSAADYTTLIGGLVTAGTGITNTSGTLSSDLSTGVSGGQAVNGGTDDGDNLTLSSTSSSNKGKILFGNSAYDEANNRLGIGTSGPSYALDIETTSSSGLQFNVNSTSNNLTNSGLAAFNWSPSSNTTSSGNLISINAGSHATISSLLNIMNNGNSVFKVGQSSITFGAPVTFTGSTTGPVNVTSASYNVGNNDSVILATAPSGSVTITLPNPTTVTGRVYTVKRADATTNTMLVKSAGSGITIDQQSQISLSHQGNTVEVVSDGTNWEIMNLWTSTYTYSNGEPFQSGNTGDLGN